MASEKFERADGELSDVEIRLECLRLATEFGPEYERKDPTQKAEEYFNWVKQVSKRKLCECKNSKKRSLIADLKRKD